MKKKSSVSIEFTLSELEFISEIIQSSSDKYIIEDGSKDFCFEEKFEALLEKILKFKKWLQIIEDKWEK